MKILMTGALISHGNAYKKPPKQLYIQQHDIIHEILIDMGHEVVWQPPVELGQKIPDDIDLVWLYLFSPSSLSARPFAMRYLWTMYQAHTQKIPTIWHHTDWSYMGSDGAHNALAKAPDEKFFRTFSDGTPYYPIDHEELKNYLDEIRWIAGEHVRPGSPASQQAVTLMMKFAHMGDIKILQDTLMNGVMPMELDLTPFTIHHAFHDDAVPFEDRKESWFFPALHTQDSWVNKQKATWPIVYIGQRKLGVGRVSENEVSRRTGQYRGILSPEYKHAGSGWWRVRFTYAAVNGTFIWAGDKDARMYSDEPVTLHEFEQMNEAEQMYESGKQSRTLLSLQEPNKQFTIDQVNTAIAEAKRRV